MDPKDCWLGDRCKQLHCNDPNGCLILFKLNYLYDQANLSLTQRKFMQLYVDADGTDVAEFKRLKNIQDHIIEFIEQGENLYLHSISPGCGKTSWSIRLMQAYFNKIWLKSQLTCKGLFINVPYFLNALKESFNNQSDYIDHIKEHVKTCDLVIWDDIGTKNFATTFEAETLLSYIEPRINNGKSNIFTSNLNNGELRQALGDRLASRICNLGVNIELHGGDKRGLKG